MPAIRFKGVDYTTPTVYVQSDASATDLENTKVPTGQTIKSYLNSKLIKRQYFSATTSANGNVDLSSKINCSINCIIGVTARNKSDTGTVYVCVPYQYSGGAYGWFQGVHVMTEVASNTGVSNTNIEGYIFYIPMGTF